MGGQRLNLVPQVLFLNQKESWPWEGLGKSRLLFLRQPIMACFSKKKKNPSTYGQRLQANGQGGKKRDHQLILPTTFVEFLMCMCVTFFFFKMIGNNNLMDTIKPLKSLIQHTAS